MNFISALRWGFKQACIGERQCAKDKLKIARSYVRYVAPAKRGHIIDVTDDSRKAGRYVVYRVEPWGCTNNYLGWVLLCYPLNADGGISNNRIRVRIHQDNKIKLVKEKGKVKRIPLKELKAHESTL